MDNFQFYLGGVVAAGVGLCTYKYLSKTNASGAVTRGLPFGRKLRVATWNIAAVNNNPFEYYITHTDAAYNKMMVDVEKFVLSPGNKDVKVSEVLTPAMFAELKALMKKQGWKGVDDTAKVYEEDYKHRKLISEFLKDKDLGKKRLTSMPDRFTNTINTVNDGQLCRPTLINCYEKKMDSIDEWWDQWKDFMFDTTVEVYAKGSTKSMQVCEMLGPIKQSKYPAITSEEEKIAIPLQTLCLAIFDATMVYMLNSIAHGVWHPLKMDMCTNLNNKKEARTMDILNSVYGDSDVIFLQETAASFYMTLKDNNTFDAFAPDNMDGKRDQNSVILTRKGLFKASTAEEITHKVVEKFDPSKSVPVADGDLLAVHVQDVEGKSYILASFHGDTNGLASEPVVEAIAAAAADFDDCTLIIGLDANTYEVGGGNTGLASCEEFSKKFVELGLTSCFGDSPDPTNYTVFNVRTFLQPQLNKAVKSTELREKGDVNPKDFILYSKDTFQCESWTKDNTGNKTYTEGVPFPTLSFPSDHGVLSSVLVPVPAASRKRRKVGPSSM